MARIWCVGMLLALTAAAGLGRWSQTAEAILMAGGQAVRLGVTLTGSMMLLAYYLLRRKLFRKSAV